MTRKKPEDGGGGPNWLDTYADMVTLLLTFFVLLFAMSTMDSNKWQALVKAFSGGITTTDAQQIVIDPDPSDADVGMTPIGNGETGNEGLDENNPEEVLDFDDLYRYLKNYVDKNGLENAVQVNKGDGYTFIIFQNNIFFDGNSSELRKEGKVILDYLADGIKNIPKQIGEIRVYGHTAQTENSGKTQQRIFDRNLSSQRANNVLLYIDLKNIISSGKMVAEGYGEYRPLVPHDGTEETRIKNRRVELYISRNDVTSSILDSIYSEINQSNNVNG